MNRRKEMRQAERRHREKMSDKTCYGCKHLRSISDAAGGGIWTCAMSPGLVLAEWGHWVKDVEDPEPFRDDCYEKER